ncbi:MAG TPA: molybdenum cofactor guanylyltransferase [Pyrinomonadaceae bacterium]|nr:molybdenum cofactor guanylyltransferase [Pyrinomonadaceae bacterium]
MPRKSDQEHQIAGFVLVGGTSSRMGENKAQLEIGGQRMSERAYSVLRSACDRPIVLVGDAGNNCLGGGEFGGTIILDNRFRGDDWPRAPIIGLYTALLYATTPWIAVLACDLPFVTSDLIRRLSRFCSDAVDAVVPVQSDSRPQPLCALYRVEKCRPIAEMMIKTGDLKLQKLLTRLSTRYVEFEEIRDLPGAGNFFINVNTPEDYAKATKLAQP